LLSLYLLLPLLFGLLSWLVLSSLPVPSLLSLFIVSVPLLLLLLLLLLLFAQPAPPAVLLCAAPVALP
jgi:hypothetical protein